MGRSNSPASLSQWDTQAAIFPFRASINGQAFWEINRPNPNLAIASRVSPGGRLLMVFTQEALRDCFVEGHADQGAQIEPDGATRASRPQPNSAMAVPPSTTLEAAIAKYEEALPAWKAARRAPPDDLSYSNPTCTQEQGAALRDHFRASRAYLAANAALDQALRPLIEDCMNRGDREKLSALIEQVPASVHKAILIDALNYRMPPSSDLVAASHPSPNPSRVRARPNR